MPRTTSGRYETPRAELALPAIIAAGGSTIGLVVALAATLFQIASAMPGGI